MKIEDATRHTTKCFRGEPASCSFACPFRMDIRSFLQKAGKGRWTAAYKTMRNAVIFPGIVSRLCEEPCKSACQRTILGDEALSLRDMEAACLRFVKDPRPENYVIPPKNERIAIIGAGPSSLSCALALAQKRFQVSVFEKESGPGGALRSHPLFEEFEKDIANQFSAVQTQFAYGSEIHDLDALRDFDAVYVATGAGGNTFGLLDSWDAALYTTAAPKVFLGGRLCGLNLMEGIAAGTEASRMIEVFLQTGKAAHTFGSYPKEYRGHTLPHAGATSAPRILPSSRSGYSEEEAKAEASRCLECDCHICMDKCEMLKSFRKEPHKIAVEVYTDTHVNAPFSSHTITRETYSCNICGYCASVCPVEVNIGPLLQLSRRARVSAGVHPAALHDFWLREMDFAVSAGSLAATPKGAGVCEYAFFPGCQLGASNPEHVLQSYAFLRSRYSAGVLLGCCGAPAYWAGDDSRMKANIERMRGDWELLGRPILVCACATCESIFNRFLPEMKTVSLYELIASSGEAAPARVFDKASVFDPCASRKNNRMQAAVRALAGKAGTTLEELSDHNRCCGYGGHISLANPSLFSEIAQNRAEAGPDPYIVYCANCKEVFELRGKPCVHILDMVFGLPAREGIPSLHTKRENSLTVKRVLMKELKNENFEPETHEWDTMRLVIGHDLQREMDRKLITQADVREAVWMAEKTGDRFHADDGSCLCSMVKDVITYWVEYRKADAASYEIFSAYSHRMRFNREG